MYAWETGTVDDLALVLLCGDAEFKVSAVHEAVNSLRLIIILSAHNRYRYRGPQSSLPCGTQV